MPVVVHRKQNLIAWRCMMMMVCCSGGCGSVISAVVVVVVNVGSVIQVVVERDMGRL